MNPLEMIAVALGLANVGLLVRRSIWNYPFGMAMVALYFVIFRDARLYGEAALQVFFFVVQGWGWWLWARAGGMAQLVEVNAANTQEVAALQMKIRIATQAVGWLMQAISEGDNAMRQLHEES